MLRVDHQQGQHNRVPLPVAAPATAGGLFHPCGGRAIGGVSTPIPTSESFPRNDSAADPAFVVGVVDTGFTRQDGGVHSWLTGHVNDQDPNVDPLPEPPEPLRPDDGHGTFVAGVILRQAPLATIRMIRAIDEDLSARSDTLAGPERALTDQSVADAIRALSGTGPQPANGPTASVINLSFCGDLWEDPQPPEIGRAIHDALDNGIVVVAAAGNNPSGARLWPAAFAGEPGFTHLYAVGAVDETASRLADDDPPPLAPYSNYGTWISAVAGGTDVLGPYVDYPATDSFPAYRGWVRWSGTSFATAVVSGMIARQAMLDGAGPVAAAEQVLANRVRIPGDPTGQLLSWVRGVDSGWHRRTPAGAAGNSGA